MPPTRPTISSPQDMGLLREFNKKYLGHPDYDPKAASLGKTFYDNYLSLSTVGIDIHTNDAHLPRPPSPWVLL